MRKGGESGRIGGYVSCCHNTDLSCSTLFHKTGLSAGFTVHTKPTQWRIQRGKWMKKGRERGGIGENVTCCHNTDLSASMLFHKRLLSVLLSFSLQTYIPLRTHKAER